MTDVTRANVQDSVDYPVDGSYLRLAVHARCSSGKVGRSCLGAEFQGTRSGGIARMERMKLPLIGEQGLQDIGHLLLPPQQAVHDHAYAWVKYILGWEQVLLSSMVSKELIEERSK